ncbi:hypothetical protein FGB62_21g14 [Gracilaria domingensis]|nr:hypothetical protein FGB62_21g14 [Gracilaria domingensis]
MSENNQNLFEALRAEDSIPDAQEPFVEGPNAANGTGTYEADDPDPPPADASPEERRSYLDTVESYCREMLEALRASNVFGEALWIEYTATFRTHTIEAMLKQLAHRWVTFLLSRGVHVTRKRFFPRALALIECLRQEIFVPSSSSRVEESQLQSSRIDHLAEDHRDPTSDVHETNRMANDNVQRSGLTSAPHIEAHH